ncbi:MAG: LysR family transcriptional regulator [Sandaracinaceae bacterium]
MSLRAVDLNLLPMLDALLEEASVTQAARRLGMSTPAVSHALKRLRRQLDDPLLVRSGRAMVRTRRAEALRPDVRRLVDELAVLLRPSGDLEPATLERRFRIHTTDHVLHVVGRALDERVRAAAPGVCLAFMPVQTDTPEALRRGEADLAIGVFPQLPPELRVRVLFRDRFTCVLREGHPLGEAPLTLDRYCTLEHVQVAPRGRPGGIVDRLLAERGRSRCVARAVPYFVSALVLAAETDYVATLSGRLARAFAGRLAVTCREPPLPFPTYRLTLVWHPRHDGDRAHAWLRERLVEAAREPRE